MASIWGGGARPLHKPISGPLGVLPFFTPSLYADKNLHIWFPVADPPPPPHTHY